MTSRAALAGAAASLAVAAATPAHAEPRKLEAEEACALSDPRITESSGLVATDAWWVTANDSGDEARIFVLSPRDCSTIGVTRFAEEVADVEALAPAPGGVWVGDIGDNLRDRRAIRVYRVPVGPGRRTVAADGYDLVYPQGPRDAEALLAEPTTGHLVVISKEYGPGFVYVAPPELSPDRPTTLTHHPGRVSSLVTDGAFFPDGRHLVVRNYTSAAVYSWPELERVGVVPLPSQRQGEGIAVAGDDLLITSEGEGAPVLRVALPAEVTTAMAGEPSEAPGARASTAASPAPEPDGNADEQDESSEISLIWYAAGGVLLGAALAALRRWNRRRNS